MAVHNEFRILGIDPGLRITGYGIIERRLRKPVVIEAGVIRSTKDTRKAGVAERIASVYDSIVEIINEYKPHAMAVEQLYAHYQHPRTAILMAHARGVIFLAAAKHGIAVRSYNATRIKKTVTANGRATKDQVQRTIQRELGLSELPQPSDVADALAVALCHYYAWKPGEERP